MMITTNRLITQQTQDKEIIILTSLAKMYITFSRHYGWLKKVYKLNLQYTK